MKKLTKIQKDILTEIGSIGTGNASTSLSKLINKEVDIKVPVVDIVGINEIPSLVGGPKELIVGVYVPVTGDLEGNIMVIFPKPSAMKLIDFMIKKELGTTKHIKKKEQELMVEIGNILSNSYLNAFTNFLAIKTQHTKPRFISTFGESIADFVLLGLYEKLDYALLLKTEFNVEQKIRGHFVLLLAVTSLDLLLKLIKKKEEA